MRDGYRQEPSYPNGTGTGLLLAIILIAIVLMLAGAAMACPKKQAVPLKLKESGSWSQCLERVGEWDRISQKEKRRITREADWCDCAKLPPLGTNCDRAYEEAP